MENGIENLKRKITPEQVKAIRLARKLGEQIAMDHPHIAQDYRFGKTIVGIIEEYNFSEVYGSHSIRVMKEAMRSALEKLISSDELKTLARGHHQEQAKESHKKGIGIFSIPYEKMREIGRKSGQRLYEERRGVHGLSLDEKREIGKGAALMRGQQPWSDEEKQYLLELCKNQEYQYLQGPNMGFPNYRLISDELERKFGRRRTSNALHTMRGRYKND